MQFQRAKKIIISEVKRYFFENDLKHKEKASNVLAKVDPKFRGLLINSSTIKKLGVELRHFMQDISIEFSHFLVEVSEKHQVDPHSIALTARRKLKAHQQYIIRNLLLEIKQKNAKLADHLKGQLELVPDLILPDIKRHNDNLFLFKDVGKDKSHGLIRKIFIKIKSLIC